MNGRNHNFDDRMMDYINLLIRDNGYSEDHRGTVEAPGRVATLLDYNFWKTLDDKCHHPTSDPPRVWGTAYRIPARHVAEVRDCLDLREMNGYTIEYKIFHSALWAINGPPSSGETGNSNASDLPSCSPSSSSSSPAFETTPFPCLIYIGQPENPQFMGVQEPQALAEHIFHSQGPSGKNTEYLYNLEESLRQLLKERHIQDALKDKNEGAAVETMSGHCVGMVTGLADDEHIFDLARRCRQLER